MLALHLSWSFGAEYVSTKVVWIGFFWTFFFCKTHHLETPYRATIVNKVTPRLSLTQLNHCHFSCPFGLGYLYHVHTKEIPLDVKQELVIWSHDIFVIKRKWQLMNPIAHLYSIWPVFGFKLTRRRLFWQFELCLCSLWVFSDAKGQIWFAVVSTVEHGSPPPQPLSHIILKTLNIFPVSLKYSQSWQ